MTGVACILRFALPEIEDLDWELDAESSNSSRSFDSESEQKKKESEDSGSDAVHSFDEENLNVLLDIGSELDGSIVDDDEYESKFEEEKFNESLSVGK